MINSLNLKRVVPILLLGGLLCCLSAILVADTETSQDLSTSNYSQNTEKRGGATDNGNQGLVAASPDACDGLEYFCNSELFFPVPNPENAEFLSMRFTSPDPVGCSLVSIQMFFFEPASQNITGAGIQVIIWEDDGLGNPGAPLDIITIPGGDIQWFPIPTPVLPTVPQEMPAEFHVGFTTLDPSFDIFAIVTDEGSCGSDRSRAFVGTGWQPLPPIIGIDANLMIQTELCCPDALPAPPLITNLPPELFLEYGFCDDPYFRFSLTSQEEFDQVILRQLSGPGIVDSITGEWSWAVSAGDIGVFTMDVQACDSGGCSEVFPITIQVSNMAPVIARACDTVITAVAGDHVLYFFDAIGPERCDNVSYTMISGPGAIDPVTGVYDWETGITSIGSNNVTVAGIDDFGETVLCDFIIEVEESGGECGDANSDGSINIGDAVFLINYVFNGGPAPSPLTLGDANDDGGVNIGDAVYLITYIFSGGAAPCASGGGVCCAGPPCVPNPAVGVTYKEIPSTTANCGGSFGLWQSYKVTAEYGACCLNGTDWQMRVKKVESTYSISACAQGRTDVNAAGDVANLADCKKVVGDLEFTGNPSRAAKKDYTSTDCTTAHEEKHQEEWETAFNAEWVTSEPLIEALSVACAVPTPDTPAEAVAAMKAAADALLKQCDDNAWANQPKHGPPDASGAYAAQKACHDTLIAALKAAFPGC